MTSLLHYSMNWHPISWHPMIWALLVSLILSLLPWGKYVLYPFRLFSTWAHECCHALMAVLMGGSVSKITMEPDTSGLTHFQLSSGRIKQSAVASAGYLGASAFGCLIYYSSLVYSGSAHLIVFGIGTLMLLTLLLWVRNSFGAFVVFTMGVGLIFLGQHPVYRQGAIFFLPFLGLQTGLNSILDLRTLFGLESGVKSDAQTMKSLLWLPAPVWAILWIALSVALMGWTVRKTPFQPSRVLLPSLAHSHGSSPSRP